MTLRKPLFLLACLLAPLNAYAGQEENEHARSALYFAERRNWADATLHAGRSNSGALLTLVLWRSLLDSDSGASFDDITRFMSEHPRWPEQKKLRIRAEMALKDSTVSDNDLIAWFGSDTPLTGVGKIALAEALTRQSLSNQEHINGLLLDGWVNGDFDAAQAQRLLADYGRLFTASDHIARTDRLLWEEKLSAAEDMLPLLSDDYQKLFKARMALIRNKKDAQALVTQVPGGLKHDAGLLYDRMRFRAAKDDHKGVREMLLAAPANAPYPEKWWKFRERQIREAIDERNYSLAKKLMNVHEKLEGQSYAEAIWLSGWLQLEFLDEPKAAYDIFYRMFDKVRYPVSKARAAYWTARAAEKSGDRTTADHWYNTASAYPTTFYGQLASLKINGNAPLHLPAEPSISASRQREFDDSDVARAVAISMELGSADLASRLISGMMEMAADEDEAAMIASIGREINRPYLSVRGAKKAMQQHGVVLTKTGYPTPKTPYESPLERPLVLAITRQESEFDPNAKSPSGALGMMQVLPSTAKETARKNDLGFSPARLYETEYNWTIGSLYLDRMIGSYDGSYVMAIAAYNAGPGNVRKWTREFGTPGNQLDSAINWIEQIPFAETRNYVQRVLENLQIYRHLTTDGEAPKLKLDEDLVR